MEGAAQLGIIVLIVLLVGLWMFFNYHRLPDYNANNPAKQELADNLTKMRRLWTEQNYLTRMSVVEGITGYTGAGITTERLLGNVQQLGRNLSNLYGQVAGDQYADLLRDRINSINTIIAQARQHKDISSEVAKLKDNSNSLIDFLVRLNPRLSRDKLQTLFDAQADSLIKKIVHTVKNECVASMTAFDTFNKTTQDLLDYIEDNTWEHIIGQGPRYL